MLTIDKSQASVRFNSDEQTDFNNFLEAYQTANNVEFATFREFIAHLAKNGIPNESANTGDVIEVSEVKTELATYAENNELPMESSSLDIVKHALTTEPKEITVEVEKEIPVELGENDLLLHLTEPMHNILKKINANRNEELAKTEHELEELHDTAIKLTFHEGNLFNWSETFYTGLE